jgi:hypothetical protein
MARQHIPRFSAVPVAWRSHRHFKHNVKQTSQSAGNDDSSAWILDLCLRRALSSNQAGFLKAEVAFPRYDHVIQNTQSKNLPSLGQLLVYVKIGVAGLKFARWVVVGEDSGLSRAAMLRHNGLIGYRWDSARFVGHPSFARLFRPHSVDLWVRPVQIGQDGVH